MASQLEMPTKVTIEMNMDLIKHFMNPDQLKI